MRRRAGEVERKLEGAGWPKLIVMLYYFTTAILFTKSQTIKEKKTCYPHFIGLLM